MSKDDNNISAKKVYKGLLECPFKSGFVEFEFHAGDRVADLLNKVEERWGSDYGWSTWATSEGFVNNREQSIVNKKKYGLMEGWLIAVEDKAGAYIMLWRNELIPLTAPPNEETEILPTNDGWYQGAVEHGCYNRESFGYIEKALKIPLKRSYEAPPKTEFDVCLIALVLVNGG
jgi:hypothetical protein